MRTAFSVEQISTLESSFKRHKYLGSAERRKLAAKMQLSEVQVSGPGGWLEAGPGSLGAPG